MDATTPESLSLSQLADLMYFASLSRVNGERNSLIIRLIYGHALRLEETLKLRWRQFDLYRGTLKLTRKNGKQEIVRDVTKQELNALLAVLQAAKEEGCGSADDYLFPAASSKSKHLTRNSIHKMIVKAAQEADIKQTVNPRILRRSAGMRVAVKTKDVNAVQKIMRVKRRNNVVQLFPQGAPRKQPNPWV